MIKKGVSYFHALIKTDANLSKLFLLPQITMIFTDGESQIFISEINQ